MINCDCFRTNGTEFYLLYIYVYIEYGEGAWGVKEVGRGNESEWVDWSLSRGTLNIPGGGKGTGGKSPGPGGTHKRSRVGFDSCK